LADEICETVAELFTRPKSLNSGDVPLDWKLASVTAIFDQGKKSSPIQITNLSV